MWIREGYIYGHVSTRITISITKKRRLLLYLTLLSSWILILTLLLAMCVNRIMCGRESRYKSLSVGFIKSSCPGHKWVCSIFRVSSLEIKCCTLHQFDMLLHLSQLWIPSYRGFSSTDGSSTKTTRAARGRSLPLFLAHL